MITKLSSQHYDFYTLKVRNFNLCAKQISVFTMLVYQKCTGTCLLNALRTEKAAYLNDFDGRQDQNL